MTETERYPLPRTFEEFNEQRRASFIRVKEFKQAGGRLVGYLCSYTPLEIIDAAGASGVALCGTSDEVIPTAELTLPANLCPLIKSTYGFAASEKCPFTYFSDIIVGETTCDGKRRCTSFWASSSPHTSCTSRRGATARTSAMPGYEECRLLKERLEELYDITITDDDLRAAARRRNRMRRAMCALYDLQASEPARAERRRAHEHHVRGDLQLRCGGVHDEARGASRRAPRTVRGGGAPRVGRCQAHPRDGLPHRRRDQQDRPHHRAKRRRGRVRRRLLGRAHAGEPRGRGCRRHPARHRRPLFGYQLLGHDTQRCAHGQHPCHGGEVPRDGVVESVLTACHTFNVEATLWSAPSRPPGCPT